MRRRLMKWCSIVVVLCMILSVQKISGGVYVELSSTPVVFGQTAKLRSKAENTTMPLDKPYTRTWTGGPGGGLLCRSGISVDKNKYRETRENNATYILEIFNFSESDVDVNYGCNFGVDSGRMTLSLNEQDFEFHPKKNMIIVHSTLQSGRFQVSIHFTKVYPVPTCNILFEDIELGKKILPSTDNNGMLYSVNMRMNHQLSPDMCSGEVVIDCSIGTKDIEIHRKFFDTCSYHVPAQEKRHMSDVAIGTIVAAVIMIIVLLVIVIIQQRYHIKNVHRDNGKFFKSLSSNDKKDDNDSET